MSAKARQAQIRTLLLQKIRSVRYGRCVRRCGVILATTGYAIFQFYTEIPPAFVSEWPGIGLLYAPSAAWVKTAALGVSIFGAILFVAGFLAMHGGAFLNSTADALWAKYINLRKLVRLDLPPTELIALIFKFGDQANPGSFVRTQTLNWLLNTNEEYVCAWTDGVDSSNRDPQRICFFVLAPLSRAGVDAIESGAIKKNKDLKPEHIARSFGRSCGLYIIEVFGSTFFQKGAVLHLLQRHLERKLANKLSDLNYALFTRPVNRFGQRQVERFGFENLGDSVYEMHRWRPVRVDGFCGSGGTTSP